MTLHIEPKPDDDHAPDDASPLNQLRAVFNAIDDDEEQTEVFDVEGSNAAVRYRRIPHKQVRAALASEGDEWQQNAQLLIEACEEIGVRDAAGEFQPLIAGERVTFDMRPGESIALHKALGETEDDMRRSVLRLFQGVEEALLRHAGLVDRWMSHISGNIARRFQGG